MTREEAEKRALELFVKYKDPDKRLNRENASNQLQRIAYLKCWEDMQDQTCKKCGKHVENEEEYKLFCGCSGCASTLD